MSSVEEKEYVCGIISNLKNAWFYFREAIVSLPKSETQSCLLSYIDKAMNEESMCDFSQMRKYFLMIKDLIEQISIGEETMEWLEDIKALLNEVSG